MACKLLNGPFECIVLRNIHCMACGRIEVGTLYILRHWNEDVHIVGYASLLVVALDLHHKSNAGV